MQSKEIIDEKGVQDIIESLCERMLAKNPDSSNLLLVGIQRRGADLAKRFARLMSERTGREIPCGSIDINLYRDDWTMLGGGAPQIGLSDMPFSLNGKKIILVDDVLFTGRTIRAALEAILDYGRPHSVRLCAFIDRGHRELPICPDFTGHFVETRKEEHVDVLLRERDGEEKVILSK